MAYHNVAVCSHGLKVAMGHRVVGGRHDLGNVPGALAHSPVDPDPHSRGQVGRECAFHGNVATCHCNRACFHRNVK